MSGGFGRKDHRTDPPIGSLCIDNSYVEPVPQAGYPEHQHTKRADTLSMSALCILRLHYPADSPGPATRSGSPETNDDETCPFIRSEAGCYTE